MISPNPDLQAKFEEQNAEYHFCTLENPLLMGLTILVCLVLFFGTIVLMGYSMQ